nr:alcohol dehydrogenase [Nitrosomonas sp.]
KYRQLGEILCGKTYRDPEAAYRALIDLLTRWTSELMLPRLSHYGLRETGLDKVVANSRGSSMKTNPIILTNKEIRQILLDRL